jgi:intein/homing endonuclease
LSAPKELSVFGEDYGTSELKFGPATLGNVPDVIENRGYFPDTRSSMVRMTGGPDKKLLVVGPDVSNFVEAKRDIAERMVYPMRSGVIDRDDDRSWSVVKELTRYALLRHVPEAPGFEGVKAVAALSAAAPRYMYEKLFDIHREVNQEEGRKLVKALSVVPQPFAVAISQKVLACTVLEAGAGNSVTYDQPILVRSGNKIGMVKIGEVVDPIIERGSEERQGTQCAPVDYDLSVLSFDPYSLKVSFRKIKEVYRHPSPPLLYKVKTRKGRTVIITKDHNLYVLRGGRLELLRTGDVKAGDYVPLPRSINFIGTGPDKINVLRTLGYPKWVRVMVTDETRELVRRHRHERGVRRALGSSLSGIVARGESIRADKYRKLEKLLGLASEDVRISARGGTKMSNLVSVDEGFLAAAGVYIAEGMTHGQEMGVCSTECGWLDEYVRSYFRRFATLTDLQRHGAFVVDNLVLSRLFFKLFGTDAGSKRFGPLLLSQAPERLAIALACYYEGDGSAALQSRRGGQSIEAATRSATLASELVVALLRFGIVARTLLRRIESKNQVGTYHTIQIGGTTDIAAFLREIGFASSRKFAGGFLMLRPRANTNADVVPCGELPREARGDAKSVEVASKLGISQRLALQYEEGKNRPSRARPSQLASAYIRGAKSGALLWLTSLAESDLFWDEIVEIKTVKPNSKYVYDVSCPGNETFLAGDGGIFVHNTQVAPISSGMIFNALITLNRAGGDCDLVAAEILRDAGYGDLAREPKLVKLFKESLGLVPKSLKEVMADKANPKYGAVFRVPNTRISIDLEGNSWQRFLIGEYFFDPSNEYFSSYYRRGFPKPADSYSEGKLVSGTTDLAEVIIQSVQKCSFEVQPALYRSIFLSGGGFSWQVPQGMEGAAVDSSTKLKLMLEEKGIQGVNVTLTKNPVYNVWQGCVAYGLYIPDDFTWDWDEREGWQYLDR